MSKFKFPKRYDAVVADAGVWFDIYDEVGGHYGEFKVRFADNSNAKFQLISTRLAKKFEVQRRTKVMSDEDFYSQVFIEYALIDWKITGEDGEAIPFSVEDARDYFDNPEAKFVLNQLISQGLNVENYQPLSPEASAKK